MQNESTVPIGKHPKSEVTNLLRSKHIKQVRRIGIMNVVIATAMSKEEVDLVEGGDIRDRSCDIA